MRNLEFRALEIFKSQQFTTDDAEALIGYSREAKSDTLATKKDLTDVQILLTKEIRDVELKIKDMEVKILQSSNNTTRWVVGLILGQTGLISGLLKIFEKI